jgi:hypothetical protein
MYYIYATCAVLALVAAVIYPLIGGPFTNTLLLVAIGALFALAAEVSEFAALYRRQHPPVVDTDG